MLDHAKARQSDDGRIEWKQADALALPFEDQSFDVVACQFGVMFFPDKVQGYKEARRVLKPGGRFLFNVWDRISENEFADVVTEALATVFPNDPPRFLARTPHGYHDVERIRAELNAAGFADISVDAVDERSKASSPRDPAIAYCQGTPLGMKSRLAMHRACKMRRNGRPRLWRIDLERAVSKVASVHLSSPLFANTTMTATRTSGLGQRRILDKTLLISASCQQRSFWWSTSAVRVIWWPTKLTFHLDDSVGADQIATLLLQIEVALSQPAAGRHELQQSANDIKKERAS